MDVEKYLSGGYDPTMLEQIVAWHNISNMIAVHTNDAVAQASEKKGK